LNPPVYPGPQHYWKEKPLPKGKRRIHRDKKVREDMIFPSREEYKQEENGRFNYYFPRKRTDMYIAKPMKSHIF
jgi:hypothetical protein